MKKIFGILLLVCSIGTLLWFVPVSITIGEKKVEEKKVEEKKIGLKGLYLDDDIETVCAKIKELNSLFPDAKYEGNSYQCWISNGPTIMISIRSLDGKVIDISFSTKGLEVLFNNKQYNNVQFLEMIAKELNPMNNIEKLSDGYKSENKELDYVIYLSPSYGDDQVDIFSIQRLSKIQEELERDEAQRAQRDLEERQEAERQEAKKVGIKGFYLDDNIDVACVRLYALSNELPNFEYYTEVNASNANCLLLPKGEHYIQDMKKKHEFNFVYALDYSFITSENGKVTKISFDSSVMNYLFQTSKFSTKEFCQTMVDNIPWLGNELETSVNNYGEITNCNRFDGKLGYRFNFSKYSGLYLEKAPKTSFK